MGLRHRFAGQAGDVVVSVKIEGHVGSFSRSGAGSLGATYGTARTRVDEQTDT
jgi:hypothetical protein